MDRSGNPGSPEPAAAPDDKAARPIRILLVEDEHLVALQMQSTLIDAGFEVAGMAATGEDALAIAARERPALAIVDIRLGGEIDGVELARVLYDRYGIRAILATANYDARTQVRAVDASPLGWLPKPFEMRSLVLKVRSAVHLLQPPPPG